MANSHSFYYNTAYWFLLLIPLVAVGFYPSYFGVIGTAMDSLIHIHFSLMAVLIVVFIAQPFLFRYKRLALHRTVGRFTYILMPPLLVSTFLMIRFSYFRFLDNAPAGVDREQLLQQAASFQAIAFLYSGLLAVLYSLAIYQRKKVMLHARYMVATALTMLGPTVDRILYFIFKQIWLGGLIPLESVAFFLADAVLAILWWKDYRSRKSTRALRTAFFLFAGGQALYFLGKDSESWASFVSWLMQAR